MTATVHPMPIWLKRTSRRLREESPSRLPRECEVICLHHHFERLETFPSLTGVFLYVCRGCKKRLMWEEATGGELNGLLGGLDEETVFRLCDGLTMEDLEGYED